MEKFKVTDAKDVGMFGCETVKDLLLLPDDVFNLLWGNLQRQRMEAQAAKVESLIEKSTVKDLLELPEAIFDQLGLRLSPVRAEAKTNETVAKREQQKQQLEAKPRIVDNAEKTEYRQAAARAKVRQEKMK